MAICQWKRSHIYHYQEYQHLLYTFYKQFISIFITSKVWSNCKKRISQDASDPRYGHMERCLLDLTAYGLARAQAACRCDWAKTLHPRYFMLLWTCHHLNRIINPKQNLNQIMAREEKSERLTVLMWYLTKKQKCRAVNWASWEGACPPKQGRNFRNSLGGGWGWKTVL